ncbi:MAG: phosphoribosylformylglycinamidine synthase subunit PurQ [Candidatus Zixiibacteriota bacterium]
MKFGVVTFPGSNGDYDSFAAVKHVLHEDVEFLWHKSADLHGCDLVILPGGFAYGDYLRAGAIARFSPIMESVIRFANSGGLVIGFCNGFQILTECGLLPGALMRNAGLRFRGEFIHMKVENIDTPFTNSYRLNEVLRVPIAHGEGNYYNFNGDVKQLEADGLVVFRYCDPNGKVTKESNPNGSVNNIAGIVNREGNILGMMPHPERAVEKIIGSDDGLRVFESVRTFLNANVTQTAAGKA